MDFIKRLKNPFFSPYLFLIVVFLCAINFIPSLQAASDSVSDETPPESTPQTSPEATDPNRPPEKTDNKAANPTAAEQNTNSQADPNDLLDDFDEEDDDDFAPRLSTYINISQYFENIFTPELITDKGLVDYGTLRRKRQDLVRVAKELKELNPAVLMALDKNEKIAFWINTYNVCTLKLIIDHYPIEPKFFMIFYPDNSIMQISGNWRTNYFFEIQGLEYTLEEIEWDFLLDRYKDPRIIFALSYASRGGAPLRNEPYEAEKLDRQLDDQARDYLQSPQGLRFDKEENILYLSNLFTMHQHRQLFVNSKYAEIKKFRDRPPDEQAWLNFIRPYLSEEQQQYLESASPDIRFMKYDWHLDEWH